MERIHRCRAVLAAVAIAALGIVLILGISGCATSKEAVSPAEQAARTACGGTDCHDQVIAAQAGGPHSQARCVACHKEADGAHAKDPKAVEAAIDWTIASCAKCHEPEAATYLYDDNAQVGPFGGSQRIPPQPKVATFPRYNEIIAGHAFTKDYNEEGAHAFMMKDHRETLRGKFETCVQCKSTKVAWAWKTGRTLTVARETKVELSHTRTATSPAKVLTIPAGTTAHYATDEKTRQVHAEVKTPDGKTYTSTPEPSADATANFNMLWATTIALASDTGDYGASCSHCHNPHAAAFDYVRDSMLDRIASDGVNPYATTKVTDPAKASLTDQRILTCSQCHVEYTCGKSGVDGVDRDAFGWSKAEGLHALYTELFEYKQDWRHKLIKQPLIKSQHSETELYWNSAHYNTGVACSDCHMPQVRDADGRVFRSHWFTSPYKYQDAKLFGAFTKATGIDPMYNDRPCMRCHPDREAAGIAQQKAVYERQKKVQDLIADSAAALGAVKPEGAKYEAVLTAHRKAHVIWENLIVSENSMGFHNYEEVMSALDEAEKFAEESLAAAKALPKK